MGNYIYFIDAAAFTVVCRGSEVVTAPVSDFPSGYKGSILVAVNYPMKLDHGLWRTEPSTILGCASVWLCVN